ESAHVGPGGTRPRRRVRPRLLARSRSPALAEDAAHDVAREGNLVTARQRKHWSKTMPPVRIGVVGLGYWGPNIVRNLHELDAAEPIWICDLRPEVLRRVGRRFPNPRCSTRFEDLLDDETVEAVVIATPVSTHYALAAASLAAGKHVLVEKPLAGSSE